LPVDLPVMGLAPHRQLDWCCPRW